MKNNFTVSEVFRKAWQLTKENLGFLIGLMVVVFVVSAIPSLIAKQLDSLFISWAFQLAAYLIQMVLAIGVIRIIFKLMDGKPAEFKDLYDPFEAEVFVNYIIVAILTAIAVAIGLVLLIIPGIIVALRLQFAIYFVVDKNMNGIDALKQSWEITRGKTWQLFVFFLAILGIIILGFIALIVGVLVAAPVCMFAVALVYRALALPIAEVNTTE